jgi:hypothetical protein
MRTDLNIGVILATLSLAGPARGGLEVGFGQADITPDVQAKPVWLAGYGHNRQATGVHDPLWARAVVLNDGGAKIALVSVDLVGIQRPTVQNIRAKLPAYHHVMVSSTHNHEGPDVVGLWGPAPTMSGVDPEYLALLESKVIEAVHRAESGLRPAQAEYGTAEGSDLLEDSRLPIVKDGILRLLRFTSDGADGKPPLIGILVQWNCHPESLGSKNTEITADFPYAVVRELELSNGCPVAYFTGAVGGLMSNPSTWKLADGTVVADGTFAFADAYGKDTAAVASKALQQLSPIRLTPFTTVSKPVALKLDNPIYKLMRAAGVMERDAFAWTGDPFQVGSKLPPRSTKGDLAIESEVSYLRLGELHVALIPGELYPELVNGQFQEPAEPNVDFPDAPLETPVMKTLPGPKTLLFGLASDEVGYIIPKRQWDEKPPFAYGRSKSQYGEINSVGPDVAATLMNALAECVKGAH